MLDSYPLPSIRGVFLSASDSDYLEGTLSVIANGSWEKVEERKKKRTASRERDCAVVEDGGAE